MELFAQLKAFRQAAYNYLFRAHDANTVQLRYKLEVNAKLVSCLQYLVGNRGMG